MKDNFTCVHLHLLLILQELKISCFGMLTFRKSANNKVVVEPHPRLLWRCYIWLVLSLIMFSWVVAMYITFKLLPLTRMRKWRQFCKEVIKIEQNQSMQLLRWNLIFYFCRCQGESLEDSKTLNMPQQILLQWKKH